MSAREGNKVREVLIEKLAKCKRGAELSLEPGGLSGCGCLGCSPLVLSWGKAAISGKVI